ncbi:MAG: RimK/LysX family protein [Pirellulales bacterium]
MKKPIFQRWPVAVALAAAGAALAGLAAYIMPAESPTQVAARRPHESIISQLADTQSANLLPASYRELALNTPIDAAPLVIGMAQQEVGLNLFAPRSLAIVPENWPHARMKYVIGATATVYEAQSDLEFQARVDTGAHTCSLHVDEYVIPHEAHSMLDNVGKEIRFKVTNHEGASQWIESVVDCCALVRTSDHAEERYKVPLSFRWNDFERMVLVTLNNRGKMNYPLLLGRNFLRSDFVVDVAVDGD